MKFLFLSCLLFSFALSSAQEPNTENAHRPNPSLYASDAAWESVYDFLIPEDHPIKNELDQIFTSSRAFETHATMKSAGFSPAKPQKFTQLIFTSHPNIKGYVIKAYLDNQKYFEQRPEFYYWVKRIKGANLIRQYIEFNNYSHLLKVPRKWIYLLPDEPSPNPKYLRKNFILVEEDMDIYGDAGNKRIWKSSLVTKELLNALYKTAMDLGLYDSLHPLNNCPFSKDGRVAFVDTQRFYEARVKFYNLTPYLSPTMRQHWLKLTKNKPIITLNAEP